MFLNALYALLKATEALYRWDLFLRGKNGGLVRNRGFSPVKNNPVFGI